MAEESTPPAETTTVEAGLSAAAPKSQKFRKRFGAPRLAADAAERQGRVTMRAWRRFGGRDGAMAFLNANHESLGGRPLDLAVASEEACCAVERAIDLHPAGPPPVADTPSTLDA